MRRGGSARRAGEADLFPVRARADKTKTNATETVRSTIALRPVELDDLSPAGGGGREGRVAGGRR